ncbi:MAG: hypothetical protein RMK99_11435 [Anaerolineales bacterium]|nr:hypothetical protein [Anaerolineales bacterium]
MNDPLPSPNERMPDWYDPFAEPRDLPTGWDLTGLMEPAARLPRTEAAPNRPALQLPQCQITITLN